MPKGPRGEKRPADAIGLALRVARIATGEEPEDQPVMKGRDGGKVGGPSRATVLSSERRREIAKQAAEARWSDQARAPRETQERKEPTSE